MVFTGHIAVGFSAFFLVSAIHKLQHPLLKEEVEKKLMIMLVAASLSPDLDMFPHLWFNLTTADLWGHRGATHSIAFVLVMAVFFTICWYDLLSHKDFKGFSSRYHTFFCFSFVGLTHLISDGVEISSDPMALLFPFDCYRYNLPFQFLPDAPIAVGAFSGSFWFAFAAELILILGFTIVGIFIVWSYYCNPINNVLNKPTFGRSSVFLRKCKL